MAAQKKAIDSIKAMKVGGQAVYSGISEPYHAKKEEHVAAAGKYLKRFHDVYEQTTDYQLHIASELKELSGKDYLSKKDAKKLAEKIQELTTDTVLNKYFKNKKTGKELKDFMKLNLTGPLNNLRRRLERGDRVNYGEIDNMMYQTMGGVRQRLLQTSYAELEDGHVDVAKEVAAMLYHPIGLEGQNRAQQLDRHKEARHVVEEMQTELEREVAQSYMQMKQTSPAPKAAKKKGK